MIIKKECDAKRDHRPSSHLAICCAKVGKDAVSLVAVALVCLQAATSRAVPQPDCADQGQKKEGERQGREPSVATPFTASFSFVRYFLLSLYPRSGKAVKLVSQRP